MTNFYIFTISHKKLNIILFQLKNEFNNNLLNTYTRKNLKK